jgi:putative transposase
MKTDCQLSIRRMARAFGVPPSTLGGWVNAPPTAPDEAPKRWCPVSGDPQLRDRIRALCEEDRNLSFGHRRIRALLFRRFGIRVNRKTVLRIMRELGLTRPKVWHRPARPKRVEKMHPAEPNQGWQIDMTSFTLSNLSTIYLVVVIDCCSRQIVGWTLSRRCRAVEWTAALRMGLEAAGLKTKDQCAGLMLRSDNGAQPCSRKFVEFLASQSVRGQYTGYDAPDDNGFVERVIRTIKEEEVWPNNYDRFDEAHQAMESYINYYNQERIHSALNYLTPNEAAARITSLKAA